MLIFNNNKDVRVFLISPIAGGIGINLTTATRAVVMDNHFNPLCRHNALLERSVVDKKKAVHCYRLAIEGTLETKIYARSVNKSGVASSLIPRSSRT